MPECLHTEVGPRARSSASGTHAKTAPVAARRARSARLDDHPRESRSAATVAPMASEMTTSFQTPRAPSRGSNPKPPTSEPAIDPIVFAK